MNKKLFIYSTQDCYCSYSHSMSFGSFVSFCLSGDWLLLKIKKGFIIFDSVCEDFIASSLD